MTPEQATANLRKNQIGCVSPEPTAFDLAYARCIDALDAARNLSPKQQRQLLAEIAADIEQREADLDEQER